MPRVIAADDRDAIDLGTLVDRIETQGLDARDEDAFAAYGSDLKKLANNRDFFADLVVDSLKSHCRAQTSGSAYGAQVLMLHRSRDFFIRANFWPSEDDAVLQDNGADAFFYNVPHDHNFSFLTVGYLGPGYWSDHYEYDYPHVVGVPDEPVNLRFVGRSRLAEGQVMLYRAHRDVHAQHPAEALSVSINIVEQSAGIAYRDQYRFDTERGTVAGMLTQAPIEPLLALSAHLGGEAAKDLVSTYAASHPSDRIRFAAVTALASMEQDLDRRIVVLERAARCGNTFVERMATRRIATIEQGREWIQRTRPGNAG